MADFDLLDTVALTAQEYGIDIVAIVEREKQRLARDQLLQSLPCYSLYQMLSQADSWYIESYNGGRTVHLEVNGLELDRQLLASWGYHYRHNLITAPRDQNLFDDLRTLDTFYGIYTQTSNGTYSSRKQPYRPSPCYGSKSTN